MGPSFGPDLYGDHGPGEGSAILQGKGISGQDLQSVGLKNEVDYY